MTDTASDTPIKRNFIQRQFDRYIQRAVKKHNEDRAMEYRLIELNHQLVARLEAQEERLHRERVANIRILIGFVFLLALVAALIRLQLKNY